MSPPRSTSTASTGSGPIPQVLAKVGVTEMPKTWDEFNAVADKLKAAGITPLAHGGQPWQDATVFEVVVLGVGGADFYRKALVELDQAALTGDTMIKVFDQLRKLRGYVDPGLLRPRLEPGDRHGHERRGRLPDHGRLGQGRVPRRRQDAGQGLPLRADAGQRLHPQLGQLHLLQGGRRGPTSKGQKVLASLIMSPGFQETFNLAKGSIPARTDVTLDKFDDLREASPTRI